MLGSLPCEGDPNFDNQSDVIVDVALQHTPSLKTFLRKIDFKSIDEIIEHYNRCDIKPSNDEVVLDSIFAVEELLNKIMEAIK